MVGPKIVPSGAGPSLSTNGHRWCDGEPGSGGRGGRSGGEAGDVATVSWAAAGFQRALRALILAMCDRDDCQQLVLQLLLVELFLMALHLAASRLPRYLSALELHTSLAAKLELQGETA